MKKTCFPETQRGQIWQNLRCLELCDSSHGLRGSKSLANRSARFETYLKSEVAEKSVSARLGPSLEGTLGGRKGPGRAGMAPTSGPGWVRNAGKQSTWRIWTGPLRTRDGTWTGPGPDPGEGLDGTPRDSNRLLGLSD